jgi:hypothetical protein
MWEEIRNAYINFVGNFEANRPIRRFRHRWEDDIKLSLKKLRYVNVDCIKLTRDGDNWWAVMTTVVEFEVL